VIYTVGLLSTLVNGVHSSADYSNAILDDESSRVCENPNSLVLST